MDVHKMSSYNRLDIIKRKFFIKKVWLIVNAFIFLPAITWVFFVWLIPMVDATQTHQVLSTWLQFWGCITTLSQCIFCIYIFLKINQLRDKLESIEWSISNK